MRNLTSSPIVVLTATRNRSPLLRDRFLPSVIGQSRSPDHVILVDDSDREHHRAIRAVAAELRRAGRAVTCVGTGASPGLASAWNRGLQAAAARFPYAWIAGLDDDDWWLPDHLAACERTAAASGADVLFARSVPVRDGIDMQPLDSGGPDLRSFLRGNPGFRGSTMFLRLPTILAVAGFDASMQSTLDRDLAVRLLLRGEARWAISEGVTVRYDVSPDRARLSSPGSGAKRAGLVRFHEKHGRWMDRDDRRAFWERARQLFGIREGDVR